MGKRGPAPTPKAHLEARGSWRAEANKSAPDGIIGEPDCPTGLSAKGRAVWRSLVPVVSPGVLARDNGEMLARYCHGLVRWWKLAAWLDDNDDTYEVVDKLGNKKPMRHPNLITYEKLNIALLRMEQEIGLTPASRTRVSVVPEKKKDNGKGRFFGGPRLAATA